MGRSFTTCPSRPLGNSESNFTKALESGTGVTVLGILFEQRLSVPPVVAAVSEVLASQPLLRSRIVTRDGRLWFDIEDGRLLRDVEVVDIANKEAAETTDDADQQQLMVQLLEDEMNTPYPEKPPHAAFQARLHLLPGESSLLILRLHPAACDTSSGPPICSQLFSSLLHYTDLEARGVDVIAKLSGQSSEGVEVRCIELPCIEDAIPAGQRNKPFWARGRDLVGYGLVSQRHAYLPFDTPGKPTSSRIIRSSFSHAATANLIQACEKSKVDMYGILMASALKAVMEFKKVGDRGEHYGVICLMNCRKALEPPISEFDVGFYDAGMMRTIHATQAMGLFELAKICTHDFKEAIKNRKHFTDMDDLNTLMVQAMAHPNLTHAGSMRCTLISTSYEPTSEIMGDSKRQLKVKDMVMAYAFHGVGACLALEPSLIDGDLQITYIYCEPLFFRSTVQVLVDSIFESLSSVTFVD